MIAEVLRELYRDEETSVGSSYSEKRIFNTAIFRYVQEYSMVFDIDYDIAMEKIISMLKYS